MNILKYLKENISNFSDEFIVPNIDLDKNKIKIIMIGEAPPENKNDYLYNGKNSFNFETFSTAFSNAGIDLKNVEDLLKMGIYYTTTIKIPKEGYIVKTKTIKDHLNILKEELNLFDNLKSIMLMGDVAIKALNYIAKEEVGEKIIPNISTYKIRNNEYFFKNIKVYPSYSITGKNFLIEKSKRIMISEDIKKCLNSSL
ncbi:MULTISPECIES: uracil-DNA glycosylase [Oceanotoga]|uniref:uracil-DNA glycosylase n=1 Tax=Oceanotoga TaxID=1255275 RepID=UPI002650F721|nr:MULTISPECIES: uracil-DNA glycosylase [Oceanotoga]MDN5343046.1 uracil-DNA glycosylase [Oceanotoga sp.]MDO7977024.1 uracil-DNA glycosylase [Oceanotoga teriensis]